MAIAEGDVVFYASVVMTDDPEGGGGPSNTEIPSGINNAIFPDVTEVARAGGRINIRQLIAGVKTDDVEVFMDANMIVSRPPSDPNVSITLAECNLFDRRTDIANSIENYLIQSSEWNGYLLEDHVIGQRGLQLFQRPGTIAPPINRTLLLIKDEGEVSEARQYVRVTRTETEQRLYTYSDGSGFVEYTAQVVTCDISDALRLNFPGSPPNRSFTRDDVKTIIRDTTVADAATYYGAVKLTEEAGVTDVVVKAESIYTQLIPSSRTERVSIDQRPAGLTSLLLATAPRRIEVSAVPHSIRDRVTQENRSFSWVQILAPNPAPGSVSASYMALGVWYSVIDDGAGAFTGSGTGTINYDNGSVSLTLPSMPDANTSIIWQWGENTAYTDRAGTAGYRPPEFAWELPQSPVKPGSVTITWESGGVTKTVTDNGSGLLTGDGTGRVIYATGKVILKPTDMIDAGGEFSSDYVYAPRATISLPSVTVDSGGFALIVLDEEPVPNTVSVEWMTTRMVSDSSGVTDLTSSEGVTVESQYESREVWVNPPSPGGGGGGGGGVTPNPATGRRLEPAGFQVNAGSSMNYTLYMGVSDTSLDGTYNWSLFIDVLGLASPGATFTVTNGIGTFSVPTDAGHATRTSFVIMTDGGFGLLQAVASAVWIIPAGQPSMVAPTIPYLPPVPDYTRDPVVAGTSTNTSVSTAVVGMFVGGVRGDGSVVYVRALPTTSEAFGTTYDPPRYGDALWSAGDLTAQQKSLLSRDGAMKVYYIW